MAAAVRLLLLLPAFFPCLSVRLVRSLRPHPVGLHASRSLHAAPACRIKVLVHSRVDQSSDHATVLGLGSMSTRSPAPIR